MHDSMKRLHEVAGTSRKADIARDLSVGASTVTNWSNRGVSKEGALAAAEKYGADANYILSGERSIPTIDSLRSKIKEIQEDGSAQVMPHGTVSAAIDQSGGMVPILSWVAAGSWSNTQAVTFDDAIGQAPKPSNLSKNGFALRVHGRSMLPEFKPNDIIYVEPETGFLALKDSDLVVVQCNDDTEATFKQLVIGETSNDMHLKPLNPDWPEQTMLPIGDCNLVGKVVGKYVEY